jgi:hypothetical protein
MPEPAKWTLQDENGNDVDVEVVVKRIPMSAEAELENLLGGYRIASDRRSFGGDVPAGTIRNLLLASGIKWMTVGGREKNINQNNPYASLPDLRDDETGESIAEKICQVICRAPANSWLTKNEAYAQVFQRYMPLEDEENPTATSTNGHSSTLARVERQPEKATSTPAQT